MPLMIPPPPYDKMYDPDYEGNIDGSNSILQLLNKRIMKVFPQRDLDHLDALYKGEISYMDRMVGWVMNELQQNGLAENTLFIFTSDHGEEFWEHQRLEHGNSLNEAVIKIPMILSLKGVFPEGRRPLVHAQLADLAPTILDLLGEDIPDLMQGESLLPYLSAPDDYRPARPIFAKQRNMATNDHLSVHYRQWKLIGSKNPATLKREWFLFDLEKDPLETRNLMYYDEPIVGRTLRQMLEYQIYSDLSIEFKEPEQLLESELDPRILKNLKELGYIK